MIIRISNIPQKTLNKHNTSISQYFGNWIDYDVPIEIRIKVIARDYHDNFDNKYIKLKIEKFNIVGIKANTGPLFTKR